MEETLTGVAMHIVAATPSAVSRDMLSDDVVERERKVLSEQALASGKPPAVVEKMLHGRMNKFYQEVVLLDQEYMVGEDKQTVEKLLEGLSLQVGGPVTLDSFVRFKIGESDSEGREIAAPEVAT